MTIFPIAFCVLLLGYLWGIPDCPMHAAVPELLEACRYEHFKILLDLRGISWVIVGGESGPQARPMHADWVRSIRDQCRAAGVPLFVKQDSGPRPGLQGRLPDDLWAVKEFLMPYKDPEKRLASRNASPSKND